MFFFGLRFSSNIYILVYFKVLVLVNNKNTDICILSNTQNK